MSNGQVKKNTVPGYISLNAKCYLATGRKPTFHFLLSLRSHCKIWSASDWEKS